MFFFCLIVISEPILNLKGGRGRSTERAGAECPVPTPTVIVDDKTTCETTTLA